ncbi:hypothetical protein L596_026974 [Steinernema carpocapsae]|uniref:Uncharacterized protein n=1 Tax=Steinernema carpocapsae TaxID=34508 RepID=A0A4U5M2Y1_STECR|nr:hypothetical protein L596_026974 [Steinernema carpocapsae]
MHRLKAIMLLWSRKSRSGRELSSTESARGELSLGEISSRRLIKKLLHVDRRLYNALTLKMPIDAENVLQSYQTALSTGSPARYLVDSFE